MRATGELAATGRDLDVAIKGAGWIAVQARDGTEAYTRAGDLRVDPSGVLTTANGNPVLGDSGPIAVPPHASLDGRRRRLGLDRAAGPGSQDDLDGRPHQARQSAGRRHWCAAPTGCSGCSTGAPASADASVRLRRGALESSNVNIAETMTNMIELARNYDLQVKAMNTAEDNCGLQRQAAADQLTPHRNAPS